MDTDLPFVVSSVQELDNPSRYVNEKLYHISGKLDEENEERRTNIKYVLRDGVRFYDLRGNESSPNLDRDGFCYKILPHTLEYAGGERAFQKYIVDSIAYIKANLGAEKVICYDYFVCRIYSQNGSLHAANCSVVPSNQECIHPDPKSSGLGNIA